MSFSVPRNQTVSVLTRVLSDREPLDQALENQFRSAPHAQRAWAQETASGTLRWKTRLELAIDSVSLKKKPSGWLRKILLIAAYQIIVQDRSHVALVVSETVDEIKKKEGEAPSRFANAILRKVADHAEKWKTAPFENAQLASIPEWMWKKLVADYGEAWARDFSAKSSDRPRTWVYSRRNDWAPEWAKAGTLARSFEISESGKITEKEGFSQGEFIVQDISSQTLVSEISEIAKKHGVKTVLDACAAPGGKSIAMNWNGFEVSASDIDPRRMKLLDENLARTKSEIRKLEPQQWKDQIFDLIWIDAPCSGSGIIRRHPDVRWLRQEKDLVALNKTQKQLIDQAWPRVREKGGLLAYSVCSVLKDEGERFWKTQNLPNSRVVKTWDLSPHKSPYGDGFWGILLEKL